MSRRQTSGARYILPILYLALALYVSVDFTRTAHDGLASLGLMAITLPVTLVGLGIGSLMGKSSFVLIPDGFGYLTSHALYCVPAVAIAALLLWLLVRTIDRRPAAGGVSAILEWIQIRCDYCRLTARALALRPNRSSSRFSSRPCRAP